MCNKYCKKKKKKKKKKKTTCHIVYVMGVV